MPNPRVSKPAGSTPPQQLREALKRELWLARNPQNAKPMQAYMKSEMPFWGIKKDGHRAICRKVFASQPLQNAGEWRDACLAIWQGAEFREERYAAIELTRHKLYREFQTLEALPMYEEMIVTGAWWDLVDDIAKWCVGGLLAKYPAPMRKKMLAWSKSRDLWKRRTSILSQLAFKEKTDLNLLYTCIGPSLSSKEFFLQKAIGWALRQYAWVDGKEIQRYVRAHAKELSALSRREALKNVG